MSSDIPNGGDLGAEGDMNGTSVETPPATTTATVALSRDVENVMYSDVRLRILL